MTSVYYSKAAAPHKQRQPRSAPGAHSEDPRWQPRRSSQQQPRASGSAAAWLPRRACRRAPLMVRRWACVHPPLPHSHIKSHSHPPLPCASVRPGVSSEALVPIAQVPEQAVAAAGSLLHSTRCAAAARCVSRVAIAMGAERAAQSKAVAGALQSNVPQRPSCICMPGAHALFHLIGVASQRPLLYVLTMKLDQPRLLLTCLSTSAPLRGSSGGGGWGSSRLSRVAFCKRGRRGGRRVLRPWGRALGTQSGAVQRALQWRQQPAEAAFSRTVQVCVGK